MTLFETIKKLRSKTSLASSQKQPKGDAEKAASNSLVTAPKQTMRIHDVALVFGFRWAPMTSEMGRTTFLESARREGFVHYVTNSYQETVGLLGPLEGKKHKRYSVALILSHQFAQGGTELFVFQQDALFGLVGLVDYSPIPGFDMIGTMEEIRNLADEFIELNASQLLRIYGNVDGYGEIETISLEQLVQKAASNSELRAIPNLVRMGVLAVAALLVLAIVYAMYHYYQELVQEQEAIVQATLNDPNRLYEQRLAEALQTTGPPGMARVTLWRTFLATLPLTMRGWTANVVNCEALKCDVQWARVSGSFEDFDQALPKETHGIATYKLEKGLIATEISTVHDLTKQPKPQGFDQHLDRSVLLTNAEAQKKWGSYLQDFSLLKNSVVTMDTPVIFGGGDVNAANLNKPIYKANWSMAHEMWSLPDIRLPDDVVPEKLTIHVNLSSGLRYKLEGSYYAKGK